MNETNMFARVKDIWERLVNICKYEFYGGIGMKWFHNKKLRAKLVMAFALVSLITGIVGGIGLISIYDINYDYSESFVDNGVALGTLGEVGTTYQEIRVVMRDYMIDGVQNEDSYNKRRQDIQAKFELQMAELKPSIVTEETKVLYQNIQTNYEKLQPLLDDIVVLALDNNPTAAMALMRGEALTIANNIQTNIDQLSTLKITTGANETGRLAGIATSTMILLTIIAIGSMILAIVIGLYIAGSISKPVNELVVIAEKIADGDLNVEIASTTKDEIGILSAAFSRMVDNLNMVMSNINRASEEVASGSKQLSISSVTLSQGATEQASSVEELTTSIDNIANQTRQNADKAIEVKHLAEEAQGSATQGDEQMRNLLKAMDDINVSSKSISKIVKAIDDIAFQTNILALNAAVEAARAGAYGKGFAVVAEEVRNLAARSAQAAKETTDIIDGSISKIEAGTNIASDTAHSLTQIRGGISKVAELVNDIAEASEKQAAGISEVNIGVSQVSLVIQSNSATSEESAAASEQLARQAEVLKEEVSKFEFKGAGRIKMK